LFTKIPLKLAVLAIGATASAWIALFAFLSSQGHEPSAPLILPVARADYYALEAWLFLPLHVVAVTLFAGTVRLGGRVLGGKCTFPQAFVLGALSLGPPTIVFWVLPDFLVVTFFGFEHLPQMMRHYVPLALLCTGAIALWGVKNLLRLSWPRTLALTLLALFAQSLVVTPILR
jgi:hypothetical protein